VKARVSITLLAWAGLALSLGGGSVGCGGAVEGDAAGGAENSGGSDTDGSGGSDTGGGDTGGGGTGGGDTGGGDTGGTDTGGGGQGDGGGDAAGGTAGATNGSENCPSAPIERLFPIIGPFWFGPDPGPCSDSPEGTTYTYEDGLVQGSTLSGGQTYVRDELGRMIESVSTSDPATFEYSGNTVTETRDQHVVVYTLSNNGYPLTAVLYDAESSAPGTYTYHYVNCRLFIRDAPGALPDRTYEYDEEGHLSVILNGSVATTFDYSCW